MTFGNIKFTGFLSAATSVFVAEYAVITSDAILAGRVLDETALSAIALLLPVFMACSFFLGLVAVSTAMLCADALGKLDRDRANILAGQGLVTMLAVGGALALSMPLLIGPYLSFMAPDGGEVTALASAFARWMPLTAVVGALDILLIDLVYVFGGEKECVISCATQMLVNILASYGLCAGLWGLPKLGISGISIGTSIACITGILQLLPFVLRGKGGLRPVFHWDPQTMLDAVRAKIGRAV